MGKHSQTEDLCLLYFEAYSPQARSLAKQLGIRCEQIDVHRFPDQECRVTLPATDSQHILIYQSLDHPDHKLIELMLACSTLREAGTAAITLIAPYLCYMRQDIAFAAGQAVSQKIIGQFLASLVDAIITVDPHLHRTTELAMAVPARQAIALSSAGLQADFISRHCPDALLLGPDRESEQWVSRIAAHTGLDYLVARKQRLDDHQVSIDLPDTDINGRNIILVDDMASTGQTLASCAQLLRRRTNGYIKALVTHALFAEQSERRLKQTGIDEIWSTDSITHSSNCISLAPLLAEAIQALD